MEVVHAPSSSAETSPESKALKSELSPSQSLVIAVLQDAGQASGAMSTLSPFAQPFMPRDSAHLLPSDSAHLPPNDSAKLSRDSDHLSRDSTHLSRDSAHLSRDSAHLPPPLTVDVSGLGELPTPSPSPSSHSKSALSQSDTLSSGLLMLAKRSGTSMRPSPCWPEAVQTLAGSRLQKTPGDESKVASDPFSRSSYHLLLSQGLQPPVSMIDGVPVGYEREQKRRSASQSSSASSEADLHSSVDSDKDNDDVDGLPVYRLFSGSCRQRVREITCHAGLDLDEILAEEVISTSRSLFDLPAVSRTESKLIPTILACSAEDGDCTGLEAALSFGMCEKTLKRKLSRVNAWSNNNEENTDLVVRRSDSNPDIHAVEDIQIHSPPRSHSLQFENSTPDGKKTPSSELSDTDCEILSDDETTLLADALTDENGNVLVDNVFTTAAAGDPSTPGRHPIFDANGNLVGVVNGQEAQSQIKERRMTGRSTFSSSDSGFGSVSDHPSISLPDLDCEGECSSTASLERQRSCPRHKDQALTLYCTSCCQVLCTCCFANDHMDCGRVLSTSMACSDLKWQLLKMQTSVSTQIQHLHSKVGELQPLVHGAARRKEETRNRMNDHLLTIVEEIRGKHERVLAEVEEEFQSVEKQTNDQIQTAEKSLMLLNYVSKFLEVLRQRDSGWELLSTFDQRLSGLLQRVLQSAGSSLDSSVLLEEPSQLSYLSSCQETALSSVLDVLDKDLTDEGREENTTAVTKHDMSKNTIVQQEPFLDDFCTADWGVWKTHSLDSPAADERSWEAFRSKTTDRDSTKVDSDSKQDSSAAHNAGKDENSLMREILAYMQRFPPPSTTMSASSTPSLYDEVMDSSALLSPSDLIDDVFHFDIPPSVTRQDPPSLLFTSQPSTLAVSEYSVQQRVCPDFPQDTQMPFVTDLHVTETGRLVFLDAANHCLKRVAIRKPFSVPVRVPVSKPLSMCSAGWERVMVSCAGRTLCVYSVGGKNVRLVTTRSTRQQYRGLVRATDALVAAACPEGGSVDLLDLGGRVLRSIMPVDFVRGPEVVGATLHGELLVVHQPATPPTTLLCFDMAGKVVWEHEMRTRHRHVSCCKLVGGADGCVYYALQGDSAVYKIHPERGEERVLLTSRHGVQFPSTLALDRDGRVLVTRNELPPVHLFSPSSQPMLPATTELDVFGHRTN